MHLFHKWKTDIVVSSRLIPFEAKSCVICHKEPQAEFHVESKPCGLTPQEEELYEKLCSAYFMERGGYHPSDSDRILGYAPCLYSSKEVTESGLHSPWDDVYAEGVKRGLIKSD